jgi:hypothetical protein
VQVVLNSDTWARQGGPWNAQPLVVSTSSSPSYHYDMNGYSAPEEDAEVLPDALLSSVTVYSSRLRRQLEEKEQSTETALLDTMMKEAGPSELIAEMLKEVKLEELDLEMATETSDVDSAGFKNRKAAGLASGGRRFAGRSQERIPEPGRRSNCPATTCARSA